MLLASVILLSCKKSTTSNPTNNNTNNQLNVTGSFSATIDSSAAPFTGKTYNCTIDKSDSFLVMNSNGDNTYSLIFAIKMPTGIISTGIYTNGTITVIQSTGANVTDYFYSTSLTFDITDYDPSTGALTATLSGVATDGNNNIYVTNGSINGVITKE